MKKQPAIVCMAVLLAALFVCGTAAAENRPDTVTLSPMAGLHSFDGEQDLETGTMFGFGLGYNFTDRWSSEFIFNFLSTDDETSDTSVEAYVVRLDVLYHFQPASELVPYLAAGLGTGWFDDAPRNDDPSPQFNYGAGLKYFLNDNLALRGEIRHILAFDDYNTNSNLAYTLGLTFLLGK